MSIAESEKFLVTLWTKIPIINVDLLVGNGGIVKYPDGQRTLVTAKHVAFFTSKPRNFTIKSLSGEYKWTEPNSSFRKRVGLDIAEAELPPGDGIEIAETFDGIEGLTLVGSIYNRPFKSRAEVTRIDAEFIDELEYPRNIRARGKILQLRNLNIHFPNPSNKGASGCLSLNKDGQVVSVHSRVLKKDRNHLFGCLLVDKNEQRESY